MAGGRNQLGLSHEGNDGHAAAKGGDPSASRAATPLWHLFGPATEVRRQFYTGVRGETALCLLPLRALDAMRQARKRQARTR